MLQLIRENEGYYTFIYYNYYIKSKNIYLNEIPMFLTFFELSLRDDEIKKDYGFLYDISISDITITSDNNCNVMFVCKVSK